jgi:hypothetical protein
MIGMPRLSALGVLALLLIACNNNSSPTTRPKDVAAPAAKKVPAGKNVTLEIQGNRRRVLIDATVCLREGQLEQLLCRHRTKEHEAILAADVDARTIHAALEAAGAKAGRPVRYDPKYEPATGSRVKVSLQYEDGGKLKTIADQEWIQNLKTKKMLEHDWVFAGSQLVPDPFDEKRPPHYLANDGDIICVSNFPSALLDLPVPSPEANADLAFGAFTERIPPVDTKVLVILEPITEGK